MDGNGRWAKARGKARSVGHLEGLKAAKRVVRRAAEHRIAFITLYTFSTENWNRGETEVAFLMGLIKKHLRAEYDFYRDNGIKVVQTGNRDGLPDSILHDLDGVIRDTAHFDGTVVNLALNYGGRDEILRAVNRWKSHHPKGDIDEAALRACLDHPHIPDPDMIIRTGGEHRLSNFLLWQSAYAELYFSDKFWPDWCGDDLDDSLASYMGRERRFGGLDEKVS